MSGYWITPGGQYYEGDRASPNASAVPQRPDATYDWIDGAWTRNNARYGQAAYAAALAAGLSITSTGTPALNGTYAIDDETQAHIQAEAISIAQNGAFTNGQPTKAWPDMTGAMHTFSIANWKEFDTAIAGYIDELLAALIASRDGAAWAAPNASITVP